MKLVYNAVLVKVNTTQDQKLPRKCGRINSIAVVLDPKVWSGTKL